MTAIDELIERNRTVAPGRSGYRDSPRPTLHVSIVTCMDARIRVFELFDLQHGDAHILRNAGGVVTDDVVRSLSLSQRKLGTREVLIVQHTDCGLNAVTDDGFKDELEQATGVRPTWAVEAFTDVHDSVRRSLARIRHAPFLTETATVRGFVYDVHNDALTEVD